MQTKTLKKVRKNRNFNTKLDPKSDKLLKRFIKNGFFGIDFEFWIGKEL